MFVPEAGSPSKDGAVPSVHADQHVRHYIGWGGLWHGLVRRLVTSNFLQPFKARKVQQKRDWYNAFVSLTLFKRQREQLPLYEDDIERMFLRKEHLTWRAHLRQRRVGHSMMLRQIEAALRAVKEQRLEEHLGYRLAVRESTLPTEFRSFPKHGQGLHVEGHAPQGAVLGLMPGMAWWGMHRRLIPWGVDTDGNYVRCSAHVHMRRSVLDQVTICSDLERYRYDFHQQATPAQVSSVMRTVSSQIAEESEWYSDTGSKAQETLWQQTKRSWHPAWWWFYHNLTSNRVTQPRKDPEAWTVRRCAPAAGGLLWDHPFAKANYINHCGSGAEPNVLLMPVSIPVGFPLDLLPYVPNRTQPGPIYGRPGRLHSVLLMEDPERMAAEHITINHAWFSEKPAPGDTSTRSQFLVMMYSLAAVATRPIENEEVFVNMRFSPHSYYRRRWPVWYRPHPEGLQSEDWLFNNLWPPGSYLPMRMLGVYDPGVSLREALADPRLMDRDWVHWLQRLCGSA